MAKNEKNFKVWKVKTYFEKLFWKKKRFHNSEKHV